MNSKNFSIKYFMMITLTTLTYVSCAMPDEVEVHLNEETLDLSKMYDYSTLDSLYTASEEDLVNETEKKYNLFNDAFKKPWITKKIDEKMTWMGFEGRNLTEINELYQTALTTNILLKVTAREKEFKEIELSKYQNLSSDLSYDNIEKGDILLTVTRSAILMGIDYENTVHHALLCTETPKSDDDEVFITTNGLSNPEIKLYPLAELKSNDDFIIVMRLFKRESINIDRVVDYALDQIGKTYNMDFTDKDREDEFYCTQLVWKAYKSEGVNIDYNDGEVDDHGLVLASDIYKSPYLYIVDYSD